EDGEEGRGGGVDTDGEGTSSGSSRDGSRGGSSGGSGGGCSGGADEDDMGCDGSPWRPVRLFDLEGALTGALEEWAGTGAAELTLQLTRLLERDPLWPPHPSGPGQTHGSCHGSSPATGGGAGGTETRAGHARSGSVAGGGAETRAGHARSGSVAGGGAETRAGHARSGSVAGAGRGGSGGAGGGGGRGPPLVGSRAGESALELIRMLQAYVDVSVGRALGGGPQRPARLGPRVAAAAVSCVRSYLHHCMRAWE
ncbi:hypothetical protein Agub_g13835, partial [Astrephomene gubernaculifera]